MSGVWIATPRTDEEVSDVLAAMNKITQDLTLRAARGECSWICADCGMTFPEGMPDACAHGLQSCTDIIRRDKAEAAEPTAPDATARAS